MCKIEGRVTIIQRYRPARLAYPHALAREDVKIKAVVDKWQHRGLNAAVRLVNRYAWSLEARAGLRSTGYHLRRSAKSGRATRLGPFNKSVARPVALAESTLCR